MKEEARKLMDKAQRALRAADILRKAGDMEFAAGRAYYAMFHAAQALLREKDLRYRKHASVHAAFGQHFAKAGVMDVKYHRWLLDAFDERLRCDYDVEAAPDPETVCLWIERAGQFLEAARQFLEGKT